MNTKVDKKELAANAQGSKKEFVACSNSLRAGVFIGFGLLLIIIGFVLSRSPEVVKEGFHVLLTSNIHLDTSSFDIIGSPGVGVPFIGSGILGIIVMVSYLLTKTEVKGSTIASAFMVMGFAFCGKSFLNVWPTFFGVLLQGAVKKKKVNTVMDLAWFSTALSPLVNTVAMYTVLDGTNTMAESLQISLVRILVACVVGMLAGFLIATFAEFLPTKHNGFTLYNAGFAAGLTGFLFFSFMRVAGIGHSGPSHVYTDDKDLLLASCLAIMMLYLLVCGLVLRKKDKAALGELVLARRKGCFIDQYGFGTSLVNMSLCGFLCLLYPFLTTTGHINAPVFACLLTVVGFASNGITLKTMAPIMLGVYAQSVLVGGIKGALSGAQFLQSGLSYAGSKNMVIAACFGCGMSPVVTEHGYLIGFLGAMIHSILVPNTGALHGWLNLYNNGFCLGLVATFFVPLLLQLMQMVKKGENRI